MAIFSPTPQLSLSWPVLSAAVDREFLVGFESGRNLLRCFRNFCVVPVELPSLFGGAEMASNAWDRETDAHARNAVRLARNVPSAAHAAV